MSKFGRHKWWIMTGILTLPILALGQQVGGLFTFTPGTTILSAQVNSNFAALAARLTAIEKTFSVAAIPDIVNPTVATNAAYAAATAVRLPIYKVTPGENGTAEAEATCNAGDVLVSGGCVGRDATGLTDTCTIARSYPIGNTWLCRSTRADNMSTNCRASPIAICIKSY